MDKIQVSPPVAYDGAVNVYYYVKLLVQLLIDTSWPIALVAVAVVLREPLINMALRTKGAARDRIA